MSGKIIMKRKREEQLSTTSVVDASINECNTNKRNCADVLDLSAADNISTAESHNSNRIHTPATSPSPSPPPATTTNRILLEALQKIIELQNELDAFEHDLDESEEEQQLDAEVARLNFAAEQEAQARRSEAEALGFAMCARETLLFLQSEGVPADSLLYKSLLERLVGQSDGLLHA